MILSINTRVLRSSIQLLLNVIIFFTKKDNLKLVILDFKNNPFLVEKDFELKKVDIFLICLNLKSSSFLIKNYFSNFISFQYHIACSV